ITLRPCPGYSEGVYASGLVVRRSFALNCDAVHAIGPHEHLRLCVRFQALDEWFAVVCRERNELTEWGLPWCVTARGRSSVSPMSLTASSKVVSSRWPISP